MSSINAPRLLLLDEATVGLDLPVPGRHGVDRSRPRAPRGLAALWATHILDEIEPDDAVVGAASRPHHRPGPAQPRSQEPGTEDARCNHSGGSTAEAVGAAADRSAWSAASHEAAPPHRRVGLAGYAVCGRGIVPTRVPALREPEGTIFSALVRPLVWLFIFAVGFRNVLGVSIIPPYQTYVLYEVYVMPGLAAMIQLFNGMQSSLSMVYDREVGSMRVLLTSPSPRWSLLFAKLVGRSHRVARPGLCVPGHRQVLGGGRPLGGYLAALPAFMGGRAHARRDRAVPVVPRAAAREFRERDELRDFPDVLRLVGALPAVAHPGVE